MSKNTAMLLNNAGYQQNRFWLVVAPSLALIVLLAGFIFINPSWIFLLQLVFLVVVLAMLSQGDLIGLLSLVVMRPAIDYFGTNSLFVFRGFTINAAAAFGVLTIAWAALTLIRRRVNIRRTPLFWPIISFFIVALASSIVTVAPRQTLEEVIRISSIFLLYFTAYHLIDKPALLKRFRWALVLSLAAPMLVAFYQLVTHTGLSFDEISNRLFGTFGHPNAFAFYLVIAMMFVIGTVEAERPGRYHRYWGWLFGLMMFFLLLTYTRGAWLGLAVAASFYGFIRHRRILAVSVVSIGLLLAVLPLLNNVIEQNFSRDFSQAPIVQRLTVLRTDEGSADFRFQLWHDMSRKVWERPILGYGLGAFPKIREQQIYLFFQGTEAHNDYLRLAVETGLIGLGAYVGLLVAVLAWLVKLARQAAKTPMSPIFVGVLGATAAVIVMSFFDNLLQGTPVMWEYWIMLGAVIRVGQSTLIEKSD